MLRGFSLRLLSDFGIIYTVAFTESRQREGGEDMDILVEYLVAITANIIGHYICKWLDRHNKGN